MLNPPLSPILTGGLSVSLQCDQCAVYQRGAVCGNIDSCVARASEQRKRSFRFVLARLNIVSAF